MTPGARIQAVIELLDAIQSGNEPTDRLIDAYFRKRRFAGSGDRRNVNQTVYEILRHRARLDWWIARTGSELAPGPRSRVIAELALEKKSSPQDTRNFPFRQKKFSTVWEWLCRPGWFPGGHSAMVTVSPFIPFTGATAERPSQPSGDMIG